MHVKHIDATKSIDYVIIYTLKLPLNEQRYHLQLYRAHSIATLLLMPGNASINVCIVENWNSFIILHVILDILHFTINATLSVRPSQTYNPSIYIDVPLPYSLITNIATQLLGQNLLWNSSCVLHMCHTVWFEHNSLNNFNLMHMHVLWFYNKFIILRPDRHITSHHAFGGGGDRNWTFTMEGGG